MLIASMVYHLVVERDPTVHELLITFFLFLTSPVSAQMIAKAHILREVRTRGMLPGTGRPVGWATLDPAAADGEAETARS